MLKIGHEVVRPGKAFGDQPITLSVVEELETVPGIPTNDREVDWYAREYPLESHTLSERASGDWYSSIQDAHPGMRKLRDEHYELDADLVSAGRASADLEPTAEPTGEDVTGLIKDRARQLKFVEVGIAPYDTRFEYKHKRGFTSLPSAILPGVRAGVCSHPDHPQRRCRDRPLRRLPRPG